MPVVNVIIGPPGTGKTSTLAARVKARVKKGDRPLICSLTRTAAREIAGRDLPVAREAVGTLHSHAYAALGRPGVAEAHLDDFNALESAYGLSAGISGDVNNPFTSELEEIAPGDAAAARYALLRARCVNRDLWPADVTAFADRWERWKADSGLIDFTDMIEQAQRCAPPCEPNVLYVDEAQDHSRLELDLLRTWARRAGRLVIVGDAWQALYTWRGAHPQMFTSDKIGQADREVLSQSYRVPRRVHDVATRWVRQLSDYQPIEYAPRPEDGEVEGLETNWRYPGPVLDLAEQHLEDGRTVMVAASCGYMLVPVLAEARRRGLPFANPWRLKRGDWNPLKRSRGTTMADRIIALLKPLNSEPAEDSFDFGHNENDSCVWTAKDVFRWVEVLRSKGLLARGVKSRLEGMAIGSDSVISQTLVSLGDLEQWFAPDSVTVTLMRRIVEGTVSEEEVLGWWESRLLATKQGAARFPLTVLRKRGRKVLTNRPRLFLGTIHSFKGAEADVVILFPDLSPRGYQNWISVGEGMDAVVRLFYVGLTRARHSAFVCRAAGGLSVPLEGWMN